MHRRKQRRYAKVLGFRATKETRKEIEALTRDCDFTITQVVSRAIKIAAPVMRRRYRIS